jgi:hypothetical protein
MIATLISVHVAAASGREDLLASLLQGERRVSPAQRVSETELLCLDRSARDFVLLHEAPPNGGAPMFRLYGTEAVTSATAAPCLDDSVRLERLAIPSSAPVCDFVDQDRRISMRFEILLAALLTGAAESALAETVTYAGMREQFGQPIGRFQAVKHRCADMAVRSELAWAQTMVASLALQSHLPDVALHAPAALLLAKSAARDNAKAAVQLHGGMGFQAECLAHRFVKRSHVYAGLAGPPADLRRRIIGHGPTFPLQEQVRQS